MPLTKVTFRQNCLKKIKNAPASTRYYRNALLNKKLTNILKDVKNSKVLIYYPLPFEADIRKTIVKIRKKNDIFLPFMQDSSFKIVPFRLPLKKKRFNIYEAGNSFKNIKKIDIAIVPAVGVDGRLQRVGFGKGMYDRFFGILKEKPYTIFIQPTLCYTKRYICDSHDVSCELLITPKILKKAQRLYH